MFRSGFPFQIWFLILSGLRLNPVLTLSYPFISLLFSFGCASTFFTLIALLKLDCEDLMYDSAQSLFFSPFFYPFFSRRIWCPPLLFHCRPSVHLPYSGILYRMYSFYGRFSRWCRISMVLHILWACAFCPAFMIRLATALVRYSAGGNGFISPSLSDLFSFSFPAFPLLLLAEVGIIFRCKDSVQPGAACGLCQWRVCENLPLSGPRFAIKAK